MTKHQKTSKEMLIYGAAAYRLNDYQYIKKTTANEWRIPLAFRPSNTSLMLKLASSTDFTPTEEDIKLADDIHAHINGYLFMSISTYISEFKRQFLDALNQEFPISVDMWKFAYMPLQYYRDLHDEKVSDELAQSEYETIGKIGDMVEVTVNIISRKYIPAFELARYSAITTGNKAVKFSVRNQETMKSLGTKTARIRGKVKTFEKDENLTPITVLNYVRVV